MDEADNERAVIGMNNPPRESIITAQEAFQHISEFLKEHPVVQTQDEAKETASVINYAKGVLKTLEGDRDGLVRPLNEKVSEINGTFKTARDPLKKLLDEVEKRLDVWMDEEEKRRLEALEEARKKAAEAERLAREAEAKEREAIENAAEGEFTDVGAATAEADQTFGEFKKADRAALFAARDAHVKINPLGVGRALSRRTTEELVITDALAALKFILAERNDVLPEKIADAIKTAARDYRKAMGVLPTGVESVKSKGL
ncbi:hypothetical protein [Methylosinus sp. PW1]|uniref:hypothetical protein n=1 Tax=Methylosinus sp. PW1 TaxID=107636 RepID=UPI00055DB007|nr:hypothetical protein [Methylosinus sp. PW1]